MADLFGETEIAKGRRRGDDRTIGRETAAPRDRRLQLRLTGRQHDEWSRAARTAGMKLSEFVRAVLDAEVRPAPRPFVTSEYIARPEADR